MGASRGIFSARLLARRTQAARGGQDKQPDSFLRDGPDALAWWRDAYFESLASRNYMETTIEGRTSAIKNFMLWAAERDISRAGQVTRPVLESYQRWLWKTTKRNGERLGWTTQRDRLGTLKDWFKWMTRQNVIMHNPASELELPRAEKRLPTAGLTLAEVARLLAVPDVSDPLGIRDRAIIELFYATGLRRSELCRLELADLRAASGTLTVRRGKGHKDRVVPVGARALHWLERYLRETRPLLCLDTRTQALFITGYGGPFNPDVLSRHMAGWMERANLRGSCHLLRHTCATLMLEGGADIRYIQQLLGHSKLDTTAIYTEVSIKQLLEVHARCHPAGRLEVATKSENIPSPPAEKE